MSLTYRSAFSAVGGVLVSGLLLASGCGPIQYITYITLQASRQVETAKGLRADKYAPYEYTAAVENLTKAKELAGHARFQDSVEFGKRSRDFAKKAQSVARERANKPEEKPEDKTPPAGATPATSSAPTPVGAPVEKDEKPPMNPAKGGK